MKKLMTMVLIASLCMSMGWAKDKKSENVKTTVFVTDIHCESCSTKIMNNVPALGKGVKDVVVNVADKTVAVTYDTGKNSDEKIAGGLKSLNVNAAPVAGKSTPTCVMPAVNPESKPSQCAGKPANGKSCCKAKAEQTASGKSCCKAKAEQPASGKSCCKEQPKAAEGSGCAK